MKILFLGDIQHPNSQNWISALKKYGNCTVIPWSLPWPKGILGRIKRAIFFILAPVNIRKIIKKEKPDLVIGYRLTSYGFIASLSRHKIIVLAAQANSDAYSALNATLISTFIKKRLAVYAVNRASLIHAWSQNMADNICKLGIPADKVFIMHRGIDLQQFVSPIQKNYDSLNIIVTRALYPEYRHDVIVKAIKKTIDKQIPVNLKIVGIGKEETKLKTLVKNLGIESQVRFYGRLNNKNLVNELAESNVYVSMPITEGVSASLIEAMACYCIPVVSDIPPNKLWINHRINGFLVQLDNIEDLANTFQFIWENKKNFKPMLKENRALIELKCSQEKNIKEFIKRYKSLINN
jgi:glycosyltransferase involved in cell wall biosynthesis